MNKKRKLFGTMMFLFGMLFFTACSSSEGDVDSGTDLAEDEWSETGATDYDNQPVYKDYIGTNQFTEDYYKFLNLVVMGQAYKDWMFYIWFDMEKGPFGLEEAYPGGLEYLFELEGEINELYNSKTEEALARLDEMEILTTESPSAATRSVKGTLQKMASFFGIIANTGVESRKTLLGVLAQHPDEGEILFNSMKSKYRFGENNYVKWVQNLNEGKYDDYGISIYNDWYENSRAKVVDNQKGSEFYMYAINNKLTPNDRAAKTAPDLWKAGADFAVSVPSSVIYGKGLMPDNLIKAYDGSKAAQDALLIGATTKGLVTATNAAINLGSKDRSGTEAQQKAREKELEEASKAYINDLTNKTADANKQTRIDVKDKDTKSPASSVVVVDENGRINTSVGSTNVPMGADDGTNVTVTGVDDNGDKFTKKAQVKKGKATTVEGSSDEKEKSLVPYAEVDQPSLYFQCKKSSETIIIDTNYKYMRARRKDKKQDWLRVKRSKKVVTVSVEENEDIKARSSDIIIDFSQEKTTISKSITIPISQEGNTEEVGGDVKDDYTFNITGVSVLLGFTPKNEKSLPTRIQYVSMSAPLTGFASGSCTASQNVRTFTANCVEEYEERRESCNFTIRVEAPRGWADPSTYKVSGNINWHKTDDYNAPEPKHTNISFNFKDAPYMADYNHQILYMTIDAALWSSLFTAFTCSYSGYEITWNIEPPSSSDKLFSFSLKLQYVDN